MAEQAGDRGPVEQVGVVEEAPDDALRPVVELEIEVDLGGARVDVHLGQVPAGARRQGRLQREQDLEEGIAAGVALGRQLLHHLLERHVGVGQGAERRLAHLREQLPESVSPRSAAARGG